MENICILILKINHQDECNWILSGRDPLPDDIQEEDENTLDDISGDEVNIEAIEIPSYIC